MSSFSSAASLEQHLDNIYFASPQKEIAQALIARYLRHRQFSDLILHAFRYFFQNHDTALLNSLIPAQSFEEATALLAHLQEDIETEMAAGAHLNDPTQDVAPYYPIFDEFAVIQHPYDVSLMDPRMAGDLTITLTSPLMVEILQTRERIDHFKSTVVALASDADFRRDYTHHVLEVSLMDGEDEDFSSLKGQRGCFAKRNIAQGEVIGIYNGSIHRSEPFGKPSYRWSTSFATVNPLTGKAVFEQSCFHYQTDNDLFVLNDNRTISLHGYSSSGAMKLVNSAHVLGKDEEGKEKFFHKKDRQNITVVKTPLKGDKGELVTWLIVYVATRDIPEGEQLLTNYGDKYFEGVLSRLQKSRRKEEFVASGKSALTPEQLDDMFHRRVLTRNALKEKKQEIANETHKKADALLKSTEEALQKERMAGRNRKSRRRRG